MRVDPAPNDPLPDPSPAAQPGHDALPPGTRFGEFEILCVLGVGGFGIVYLAHDHSLERQVALKEYMPVSLASRGAGAKITVRSLAHAETYAMGLRSFVNEARMLARFDHPSLVRVYRFWEDNATAYMVMPYLQGATLRDARRAMQQPPGEAWLRNVLEPMLDALEQLHRVGVYHRDIAPDNIVLGAQGAPILLDFGAARRVISGRHKSLTAILKPSYAPIEQYAEMAAMPQGPWTDLYALGAVMHYLLFGVPPSPSTARAVQDDAEELEQRVVVGVSPHFVSAVAWMLGVRPLERPQSVASLRAALAGHSPVPARVRHDVTVPAVRAVPPGAADAANDADTPIEPTLRAAGHYSAATRLDAAHRPTVPMPGPHAPVLAVPAMAVSGAGGAPMRSTPPGAPPPVYVPAVRAQESAAQSAATPPRAASRRGLVASACALAALLVVGGLWTFVGTPRPTTLAGAADTAPSVAPVASLSPRGAIAAPLPLAAASAIVRVAAPASVNTAPADSARSKLAARRASEAVGYAASRPLIDERHARSATAKRAQLRSALPLRVAAGPSTAREACGDRRFIALAICMDRECERTQLRKTPECVRILDMKRRRAER